MKKVALIFGASRGLGAEIAVKLHQDGYSIAITGRTLDKNSKVHESLIEQGTLNQLKS